MSSPPKFWLGFLNATGQEHLATDPRFAERLDRIRHQDDLISIMTPVFRTKPREAWCAALEAAEVPYAPAYDSDEALDDPQAVHLRIRTSAVHPEMGPFTTVRPPYAFDGETDGAVLPPPTLDEHGAEIRAEMARRKAG
jgi:crotonobetainyl-CoA:carnitine CoA-transferase CaiB-like acyl-CoA transferase